jgi:hypothetical protein
VSGTLVFSTSDATVVADEGRRDARTRSDEADAVGATTGARPSPLDLPPTRRKRDDGDLVN